LLPDYRVDVAVTVGQEGPLFSALSDAGIPVRVCPIRAVPNRRWPFPFAAAVIRLAAAIRAFGSTLLHVNEHDNHLVAARAARLTGVPLLTHVRFRPDREYCHWLFKPPYAPSRLFFTSQTQMEDSAEAVEPMVPRTRWRLLPNGLDFSRFGTNAGLRDEWRRRLGLSDGTIALGMASPISKRKRVDHFIRLIARLRQCGLDVKGYVAGRPYWPEDSRLEAELKDTAAGLVGEHVKFLGYVEPSEPLYYAWDVCISASSYETFGNTVLEALACRCPVVAYPGGSVQEIGGPGAVVVPDADEDSLYRQTRRLCEDAAERRRLAENGYQHAARSYDINNTVAQLAREYATVARQPRP